MNLHLDLTQEIFRIVKGLIYIYMYILQHIA